MRRNFGSLSFVPSGLGSASRPGQGSQRSPEARLAGADRAAERRWAGHERDHARDRQIEDLRLALAGAFRRQGRRWSSAREDPPLARRQARSLDRLGSDSNSMKCGGEFALFPLENQRHATQFWKSLFRPERACCGERFLRRRNDGRDGQGRSRRGVLSRLRGGVAPGPQPLRASRTRLALFGTRRSPPLGDTAVFLRATRLPEADICRAFRGNRASSAGASNVAAGTYRPPFRLGAWRPAGGQLR